MKPRRRVATRPSPEADQFDLEYWSLEQAKLGKAAEKRLARHVAVVTGGAGGIGIATGEALRAEGAEVVLIDRDEERLREVAEPIGAMPLTCDLTDSASVQGAFDRIAETFGGVDVVISNAGAAWQSLIGEVSEEDLRASFEINFFAHQFVAKAAVACMIEQGTGGALLFNASKVVFNPGPLFGPYSVAKAATLALMRQYAVEYGEYGIRVNAVNPDRVRTPLLDDAMIEERAAARGMTVETYMRGNLLRREVLTQDVASAFVSLALARKTSGSVMSVDGGNIAAAVR